MSEIEIKFHIECETSKYLKYASIKKSLLESKNYNQSDLDVCEKYILESLQAIESFNKQLMNEVNHSKASINRQMLIRREAYNG